MSLLADNRVRVCRGATTDPGFASLSARVAACKRLKRKGIAPERKGSERLMSGGISLQVLVFVLLGQLR